MTEKKEHRLSIAMMLDYAVNRRTKTWSTDRSNTVGASEIGQCERRIWFSKKGKTKDKSYTESWGAIERGNLIENHHWEPGIRQYLSDHFETQIEFLLSGGEQTTFVDGYLSATPDGLLINRANHKIEFETKTGEIITLNPNQAIALECKSIDPRINLKEAKDEHQFQTKVQVGLLRQEAKTCELIGALVSYVNASWLDDVDEFFVPFDPGAYQVAKERANRIMLSEDPLSVQPEGKMAGGKECEYCPFASYCRHVAVTTIPEDHLNLSDQALAEIQTCVNQADEAKRRRDEAAKKYAATQEHLKSTLRRHGTRRANGDGWSVAYSAAKGRVSVDISAAEAAGLDLSPFKKEGDPSERLTIKVG